MYQIEVENIKCSGCASTIQNSLLKIKNVAQVKINVDSSTVVIIGEANRIEVVEKLA